MPARISKIGVWFVGARGSVATTAAVGAFAIAQQLTDRTGLVSDLPELSEVALPDFDVLNPPRAVLRHQLEMRSWVGGEAVMES